MIKLLLSLSIFSYSVCQAANDQDGPFGPSACSARNISVHPGEGEIAPLPSTPSRVTLSFDSILMKSTRPNSGEMYNFVTVSAELADAKERQRRAIKKRRATEKNTVSDLSQMTINENEEEENVQVRGDAYAE